MNRAQRQARHLLIEMGVGHGRVPIRRIARRLGAEIIERPLDRMAGMLVREGDRTIIAVNESDPEVRKRFSIAHEIGHMRLHPGRDLFLDHNFRVNFRDGNSQTATDAEEIEANQFAAEVLMPAEKVKAAYIEALDKAPGVDPEELVRRLAGRFVVSRMAMSFRLANLGLTSLP